jgi:hypothetical protein
MAPLLSDGFQPDFSRIALVSVGLQADTFVESGVDMHGQVQSI